MTPWVLRLLFANFAAYLLIPRTSQLFANLLLVPADVLSRPWTPVTYMFLHGDFWHILFNMVVLFFFGPRLEATLGSRKFPFLYLFRYPSDPPPVVSPTRVACGTCSLNISAAISLPL